MNIKINNVDENWEIGTFGIMGCILVFNLITHQLY